MLLFWSLYLNVDATFISRSSLVVQFLMIMSGYWIGRGEWHWVYGMDQTIRRVEYMRYEASTVPLYWRRWKTSLRQKRVTLPRPLQPAPTRAVLHRGRPAARCPLFSTRLNHRRDIQTQCKQCYSSYRGIRLSTVYRRLVSPYINDSPS